MTCLTLPLILSYHPEIALPCSPLSPPPCLLLFISSPLSPHPDTVPLVLVGAELSMVDIMFAPFLERMAASLPYYKGFIVRDKKYPNLLRWYENMDRRPSYVGIKSDYVRSVST